MEFSEKLRLTTDIFSGINLGKEPDESCKQLEEIFGKENFQVDILTSLYNLGRTILPSYDKIKASEGRIEDFQIEPSLLSEFGLLFIKVTCLISSFHINRHIYIFRMEPFQDRNMRCICILLYRS